MSHFTVLVVGPDVESQIERYSEHRTCFEKTAPRTRRHHRGGLRPMARKSVCNPDGHWDWWVVGGRWAGFFPIKPGASGKIGIPSYITANGWVPSREVPLEEAANAMYERLKHLTYDREEYAKEIEQFNKQRVADVVRLGDVDFEVAWSAADKAAREEFATWEACFTEHGRPRSWNDVRDEELAAGKPIEEGRALYHSQPCIALWRTTEQGRWSMECPVAYLGFEVDKFAERQRNRRLTPYALVQDGVWTAKGKMGWFALSDDQVTQDQWNAHVTSLYKTLPQDTLLTLVDCHV